MKVLGKRALIKRTEEEKKIGGFIIPDSVADKKNDCGIVIDMGEPNDHVKIGQKIYFAEYAARTYPSFEKDTFLVNYDEIFGVDL